MWWAFYGIIMQTRCKITCTNVNMNAVSADKQHRIWYIFIAELDNYSILMWKGKFWIAPHQQNSKKKKKSGRQIQDMSRIHVEKYILFTLKTIITLYCNYRTIQTQILSKHNSLLNWIFWYIFRSYTKIVVRLRTKIVRERKTRSFRIQIN
jgi:hypothetical protein